MNRISKELVADAVAKNQIPLRRYQFLTISGDKIVQACALCQLAMASGVDQHELRIRFEHGLTQQFLIESLQDYDKDYLSFFLSGFDDNPHVVDRKPIQELDKLHPARIAYEDGILVSTLLGEIK